MQTTMSAPLSWPASLRASEQDHLGLANPSADASSRALPISSKVPSETCLASVLGEHHHIAAHFVIHPFTKPRARSKPRIWSATSPALPASISHDRSPPAVHPAHDQGCFRARSVEHPLRLSSRRSLSLLTAWLAS